MTATKSIMDEILGLEPMSSLEHKKIEVSNALNALMVFCGFRQKDLSHLRKWKKSYVSKILSGDQNLTIKTIYEFSETLGYDFDLVFYRKGSMKKSRQPWSQIDLSQNFMENPISLTSMNSMVMVIADLKIPSVSHASLNSFIDIHPEQSKGLLSYLDLDSEVNTVQSFPAGFQQNVGELT